MNRARVALVGSGRMGQIRASILYANPRFELCAVVDTNFSGAETLAEKYSTLPFESLQDAIAHFGSPRDSNVSSEVSGDTSTTMTSKSSLVGVVLSTPTFSHESLIKEAAKAGLFIFCEKPIDETADKIEQLFDYCNSLNVKLCCGFQRRFDDSYVATAEAVRSGDIGKPLMSTIFFADHPCPPMEFLLTGGNIFSDLSAHDVDFIRWALEDDVETVYATGTSSTLALKDADVHDNATMVMKFKKGAVVTLTLSRSAVYGYDQRCEIFGEKGLATVGNEHANASTLSDRSGIHQARLKHSFPQRFHQAFSSELDCFADVIVSSSPWPIKAGDCIAVQMVSDAARKSCESGQVITVGTQRSEKQEHQKLSRFDL